MYNIGSVVAAAVVGLVVVVGSGFGGFEVLLNHDVFGLGVVGVVGVVMVAVSGNTFDQTVGDPCEGVMGEFELLALGDFDLVAGEASL